VKLRAPLVVFIIAGLALMEGVAWASGIPMATEWSWKRDGGRILNSLVVLGAVVYLVIRYGAPIFRKRAEEIAGRLESLENAKRDAEAKLKEYEARLVQIEAEAKKIHDEAAAEGQIIKKLLIEQAEDSARRIVEKASEQIGMESSKAREKLRDEALEVALRLAEELLKNNVGPEDQKRLVDGFLKEMARGN
jgi:F-type H+-transporting ATPase subunit b